MTYKTIFFLLLCLEASAEHLIVKPPEDTPSNVLFSQLLQYRGLVQTIEQLQATAQAAYSVLQYLSPSIQKQPHYTGLFTANCTIFFNNAIEQVDCDVNPTDHVYRTPLTPSSEILNGHALPSKDKTQIAQSNILYADIFADWRSRKSQEFNTDLYFKTDGCPDTASVSTSPSLGTTSTQTTPATSSVSKSISVPYSRSMSPCVSHSVSSSSTSSSNSATQTVTATASVIQTNTPQASPSTTHTLSQTQIFTNTPSLSANKTTSPSQTPSNSRTGSPIASISASLIPTLTNTHTSSVSSASKTTSPSQTPSNSQTRSPMASISASLIPTLTNTPTSSVSSASKTTSPSQTPSNSQTGSPMASISASLIPTLTNTHTTESRSPSLLKTASATLNLLVSITRSLNLTPSHTSTKTKILSKTISLIPPTPAPPTPVPTMVCNTAPAPGVTVDACGSNGSLCDASSNTQNVAALTWQCGLNSNTYSYNDARNYCSSLGTSWRLPTLWELNTLYSQRGVLSGFSSSGYWTSTSSASTNQWIVVFNGASLPDNGFVPTATASPRRVICVH